MKLFGKFFGNQEATEGALAWHRPKDEAGIQEAIEKTSFEKPVLVFKHSTRCSISATALGRIERAWDASLNERVMPCLILVVEERPLSNAVARLSGVEHQSPQVLLFKGGKCVYHSSHLAISLENIKAYL